MNVCPVVVSIVREDVGQHRVEKKALFLPIYPTRAALSVYTRTGPLR